MRTPALRLIHQFRPLTLTLILLFFIQLLQAQDFAYDLSGFERVEIWSMVNVHLKSHDNNDFLIKESENQRAKDLRDSLRSIFASDEDNSGFALFFEAVGKTLKIKSLKDRLDSDHYFYLPRSINIFIEIPDNNDVEIKDFSGEIEAITDNGDIMLSEVNGPVVASSTNGKISVSLKNINQNSPTSLLSSNGDIEMYLPVNTSANLTLRTSRGEILTDFGLGEINKDSRSANGKFIKTKVGKGGVRIDLQSGTGDILIRKRK